MTLYSYKYRLYPNQEQQILLNKHFGATRFVYNHFLNKRKTKYLENKEGSTYYQDCKELTELKKSLPWMKEIYSQSLQYALKCLDSAYNRFFKGLAAFPTFKAKHHSSNSFHISQNVKLADKLYVPKFLEGIKIRKHRELEGKIKFATISKNKCNQYFVSITVERELIELTKIDKEVGIDLGLIDLAIDSDGQKYKNKKILKKYKRKLKHLQRVHSKKKKGSKNKERARVKLAKMHQKIRNIRIDNLHKATTKIVNENQVIYLENLAIQNMMKNHCLAGSIADASWGEFNRQLEYKSAWYGREVFRLNRFFPSSKLCSNCGYINQGLKLKIRNWTCPCCGCKHDRDVNAAKNILKQGQAERKILLEQQKLKRMDSEMNPIELSIG